MNLGTGVLTWNRTERVTDRYGTVYLIAKGRNSLSQLASRSLVNIPPGVFIGKKGVLVANILETRKSTHIGDLFRSIKPRIPEVGARIELGRGELFTEPAPAGGIAVGLRPADGRDTDWLDVRALYDAHEQTVELLFENGGTP